MLTKFLKAMKNYVGVILPLSTMTLCVAIPENANAQVAIAEIIKAGVKKVIKAVDLKLQRLQNETLWLQNAQKVMENTLSELELDGIADWSERQLNLVHDYYESLKKVKSIVATYERVKDVTLSQKAIIAEYQNSWNILSKSQQFSPNELKAMEAVYAGILQQTVANIDQVLLVIHSYRTQLTDAERMKRIDEAAAEMLKTYADLRRYNGQNRILMLQRESAVNESKRVRELHEVTQ